MFNKDQTALIQCPGAIGGNYIAPESVTTIQDFAFSACTLMTSITLPNSIINIGEYAIDDCTALAGVYFQGSAPIL